MTDRLDYIAKKYANEIAYQLLADLSSAELFEMAEPLAIRDELDMTVEILDGLVNKIEDIIINKQEN